MAQIAADEFVSAQPSSRMMPSFLGRDVPPGFELRVVVVPGGGERPYVDDEWRDALVVVEDGAIELECKGGAVGRFRAGDVLWICGLGVRVLRNRGTVPAVLAAVTRRR
jgi:hypothetical protein